MKALAFLMVLTPLVEICARFNGYSAIAQKTSLHFTEAFVMQWLDV